MKIKEGSHWFRRFVKEVEKMSPHIKFVKIKYGFYRIYWAGTGENYYVHEVYKEMPYRGYDIEEKDMRLISQKYFQEYEDQLELTRKIKNYVEGYVDSISTMRKRIYQIKNSKEHRKVSRDAFKMIKVK